MGICYNSAVIDAPVDAVWKEIRDFHQMTWAHGVVSEVEKIGTADGTTPGAVRVINRAFRETLRSIDEQGHQFSYSIDDGPGPLAKDSVRRYLGSVRLLPVTLGNQTFVEWCSEYEASDDQAVAGLCNPVYQALLGALQRHFEISQASG